MRRVNVITAIVVLALAGFVLVTTRSLPQGQGTLSPAFFPNLIAGLLIAFGVALLWQGVRGKEQEAPSAPRRQTLVVMLLFALYVLLLPYLGFLVTTPAFLMGTGLILAESVRRWWKPVLLSAVLTTGGLYYLFSEFLNVPLP